MSIVTVESRKPGGDLRRRIALSNRTRLSVGPAKLESITSTLASSRSERTRFIEDPTAYLKANALPVSSCNLVQPSERRAQTTEVLSNLTTCAIDTCANADCFVLACLWVTSMSRTFGLVAASGYEVRNDDPLGPGRLNLL